MNLVYDAVIGLNKHKQWPIVNLVYSLHTLYA